MLFVCLAGQSDTSLHCEKIAALRGVPIYALPQLSLVINVPIYAHEGMARLS